MNNKTKIRKLNNAKNDLSDDAGRVSEINRRVDDLIDEFNSLITAGCNSAVNAKLETYKEKYQSADFNLNGARIYIQREIDAVYKDMEKEEQGG